MFWVVDLKLIKNLLRIKFKMKNKCNDCLKILNKKEIERNKNELMKLCNKCFLRCLK